jgi:hypothetical protein
MQRRTICVQSCSRALTSVRPAWLANVAWFSASACNGFVPSVIDAHWVPRCRASLPGSAPAPSSLLPVETSLCRAAGAVAVAGVLERPEARSMDGAVMPQLNVPAYCMVSGYADRAAAVPSEILLCLQSRHRVPRILASSFPLSLVPPEPGDRSASLGWLICGLYGTISSPSS